MESIYDLPREIYSQEISSHLDRASLLVYKHVSGEQLPARLAAEEKKEVYQHGISFVRLFLYHGLIDPDDLCFDACLADNYELFVWAHQHGYPYKSREPYTTSIPIHEYFQKQGTRIKNKTLLHVIKERNLETLKWLYQQGLRVRDFEIAEAAYSSSLSCLRFLLEQGAPTRNRNITVYAARNSLEVLKCCLEYGCSVDEKTTASASYANFDCLKYLLERGCPIDQKATYEAVRGNRLDILTYLVERGVPLKHDITKHAMEEDNLEGLQYLLSIGCVLIPVTLNFLMKEKSFTLC